MDSNEQLYEIVTKMYVEMQDGFIELRGEMQDGLQGLRGEMQGGFKEVNERLDKLDSRVTFIEENHGNKLTSLEVKLDNLDNKVTSLDFKFDNLDNKLDDIEANNASRHVLMGRDINEIKDSLSRIEIVTADNWGDIARLKVRENNKDKY